MTLSNAHIVAARPFADADGERAQEPAGPAAGSRVRVEWPHDDHGGWRLARNLS